jgi:hypothetical protein
MKYIYAILFLIFGPSAVAQTIGLHTISVHQKSTYDWCKYNSGGNRTCEKSYNNTNLGLYYIHESGATVGGYRNSYGKNTFYAGYTASTQDFHGLSAVATFALATGYSSLYSVGVLRPVIAPGLRFTMGSVAMRYTFVPGKEGFQHLSLEYKL